MSLYDKAAGNWTSILDLSGVTEDELDAFLEYRVIFLANFGYYRVIAITFGLRQVALMF